jgi:hypothetical protein
LAVISPNGPSKKLPRHSEGVDDERARPDDDHEDDRPDPPGDKLLRTQTAIVVKAANEGHDKNETGDDPCKKR